MAVQGSGADAGLFRNIVQADVAARPGEGILRDLEDALAIALCVGTRLSRDGFGAFCGQGKTFATGGTLRLSYVTETLSVLSADLLWVNVDMPKCPENGGREWQTYLVRRQRRKMFWLA